MLPLPSVLNLTIALHSFRREKLASNALLPFHSFLAKNGLDSHPSLGNCLVPLLAAVGLIDGARKAFDRIQHPKHWLWNSLITLYVKYQDYPCAFSLYRRMLAECAVHPELRTFVALLQASAKQKDLETGIQLHVDLVRMGILENNLFIGTTLLDMYLKCGLLGNAREIFLKLQARDAASWNALIAGYIGCEHEHAALDCYEKMQRDGVVPDAITFSCSLKSCGAIGALDEATGIHAELARKGFLKSSHVIGNALVDMYARLGMICRAAEVFSELPVRDVVSWTTLLAGYVEHGFYKEALKCLESMQIEGVFPNAVTYVWSLKACSFIPAVCKGCELHAEINNNRLLERNPFLGSTLIDMYAKFGLHAKAQEVFDEFPFRNVFLWTSLISGYAEHGHGEEALHYFTKMQFEGIPPNSITYISSLKACGSIGASNKGREIHADVERRGLESDIIIGTALVDMYARCGCLDVALHVFDNLSVRDYVSWNALITGYAQIGESENVFSVFNRMTREGVMPDVVTFLIVLSVCSQMALLAKGQMYFDLMSRHYGIVPIYKHFYRMIDLLFQVDEMDDAIIMMKNQLFHPDSTAWRIALSACRKRGNTMLAKEVFTNIMS